MNFRDFVKGNHDLFLEQLGSFWETYAKNKESLVKKINESYFKSLTLMTSDEFMKKYNIKWDEVDRLSQAVELGQEVCFRAPIYAKVFKLEGKYYTWTDFLEDSNGNVLWETINQLELRGIEEVNAYILIGLPDERNPLIRKLTGII